MTDNEADGIIDDVFEAGAYEVGKLREMGKDLLRRTAGVLADCEGLVHTAGCGTSAMAAQKVAHSLCCVEIHAAYLNPSDAVHGQLGRLKKGDVIIFFSKGGNTSELVRMVDACQAKGVTIITVSEDPLSSLARCADIYLQVKVDREPCPFNSLATASTLAEIAVFDAICILLMYRKGYSKHAFLLIHPGGAVGEKLARDNSLDGSDN
jgi:D-arabinose 5-phosphate isomerase GutQ